MKQDIILQTNGLSKVYAGLNAADNISLTVYKGDIYGFVGMNGSGKTTFIRMITSLIGPSSGSFRLFGEEIRNAGQLRRISSMVETPSIYLNLSARDCLRVQARIAGIEKRKIEETVSSLLDLVGLTETKSKPAKQFSLGMRQRLGIATALIGDPEFMLLDEPTNGLDPAGIVEIRELLQTLNRERGITIFISSHILAELGKLATRYGFIHQGRLIQEVSAEEMHSACQKRLIITVDNVEKAAELLGKHSVAFQPLYGQNLVCTGAVTVSQMFRLFDKAGVELLDAQTRVDDLESYFMNLIGGTQHASH